MKAVTKRPSEKFSSKEAYCQTRQEKTKGPELLFLNKACPFYKKTNFSNRTLFLHKLLHLHPFLPRIFNLDKIHPRRKCLHRHCIPWRIAPVLYVNSQ